MPQRITRKWRPPLWFVLAGAFGAVLIAPLVGIQALRILGADIWSLTIVILAILLITAVLGWLLWRLILYPVTSLAQRAKAIESGHTSAREPLDHYGTPELVELGQNVLDMARSLHDRETSIRTFTNHVTHELRTPMTAISAAAELLGDGQHMTLEDHALIAAISTSAKRMENLLVTASDMAAAREPGHNGQSKLSDLLAILTVEFPDIDIQVTGDTLILPIAQSGLGIVLKHMIGNSVRHQSTYVGLDALKTSIGITLYISDDGTGIAEGNRNHIFEPFYTTNREIGGTGMGLSIVRSVLTTQGASISLATGENGARFLIKF